MPTINVGRYGRAFGQNSSTFSTARTTILSSQDSPGFNTTGFKYVRDRNANHQIVRAYFYFDTSTITYAPDSCTLNIEGYTSTNADNWIVVSSSAFGGDGSSVLTTSDYWTTLDISTAYSSQSTTWGTTNNSISLNSTALNDMGKDDYFICALVQHDNDYSNVAASVSTTDDFGIEWTASPNAYLDYVAGTPPYPSGIALISNIASANISSVSGISYSSVSSINGIS